MGILFKDFKKVLFREQNVKLFKGNDMMDRGELRFIKSIDIYDKLKVRYVHPSLEDGYLNIHFEEDKKVEEPIDFGIIDDSYFEDLEKGEK